VGARKTLQRGAIFLSSQFLDLRLRLLQPEPHAHVAVHRRGGGEVLVRLLAVARAPVQLAEAQVPTS
jgi:hypothetical protein